MVSEWQIPLYINGEEMSITKVLLAVTLQLLTTAAAAAVCLFLFAIGAGGVDAVAAVAAGDVVDGGDATPNGTVSCPDHLVTTARPPPPRINPSAQMTGLQSASAPPDGRQGRAPGDAEPGAPAAPSLAAEAGNVAGSGAPVTTGSVRMIILNGV